MTLLSAALLIVSVVGFTRTLQRTYQAAWLLPTQGLRGYVHGLLGAAALVGEVVLALLVGLLVDSFRGAALVTVAVYLVLSVLLWWPVQRLLPGIRSKLESLVKQDLIRLHGVAIVTWPANAHRVRTPGRSSPGCAPRRAGDRADTGVACAQQGLNR